MPRHSHNQCPLQTYHRAEQLSQLVSDMLKAEWNTLTVKLQNVRTTQSLKNRLDKQAECSCSITLDTTLGQTEVNTLLIFSSNMLKKESSSRARFLKDKRFSLQAVSRNRNVLLVS
ncbi:uncharacterized protein [Cherax quadricarinatus]|uniref:uncharacterized protein isoform X1 n=1 Tax=Cherax quadricarinatus TaxID=27406 RepID=UPI00387ECCD7